MNRIAAMMLMIAWAWPLAASARCWTPVVPESQLTFQGTQADAAVRARFETFDATFCLDGAGGVGNVSVTVHTDSVASALPELTKELEGELFFHADKWPTATFKSETIEKMDENRYVATGQLRIRDVSHDVQVPFTFRQSNNESSAQARGEFTIKRLDFNIGLGEWKNTDWVGDEVTVRFDVTLQSAGPD